LVADLGGRGAQRVAQLPDVGDPVFEPFRGGRVEDGNLDPLKLRWGGAECGEFAFQLGDAVA